MAQLLTDKDTRDACDRHIVVTYAVMDLDLIVLNEEKWSWRYCWNIEELDPPESYITPTAPVVVSCIRSGLYRFLLKAKNGVKELSVALMQPSSVTVVDLREVIDRGLLFAVAMTFGGV